MSQRACDDLQVERATKDMAIFKEKIMRPADSIQDSLVVRDAH